MLAVVTGSSGFIGLHLVEALLARGATVRAIVRPRSLRQPAPGDTGVERHVVDLLDPKAARDAAVWEGVTHVFHAAGVTKARTPEEFRAGNVHPTANLMAALAARAVPPRVILISSQAAAGPARSPEAPLSEADAPRPIEAYGASKLEAEREAGRHGDRVPVVVIRPAAVYGPRDRDFLPAFRQASGRIALHAAPRDQRFSIVHVRDLVAAIVTSAESATAPGRSYFVANDQPTSWRALYATIAGAAGAHPFELQIPLWALRTAAFGVDSTGVGRRRALLLNRHKAAMAVPRWWTCTAGRARDELGWEARVELQSGVRETYLWYARAGWVRGPQPSADVRSIEELES